MKIAKLFEKRPTAEIVTISPKEREEILKEAESFVLRFPSKTIFNGGGLTNFDSAVIRSVFETFVRSEALGKIEAPIIEIDVFTYKNALEKFKEFMKETFESYESLRNDWLSQVKSCLNEIFDKSKKVFEPYVIGSLCDRLYINNHDAKVVVEELKSEHFVDVVDRQYSQNILARVS